MNTPAVGMSEEQARWLERSQPTAAAGSRDPLAAYVSEERMLELISVAEQGYVASAIRLAIREAVEAVRTGVPAAPTATLNS